MKSREENVVVRRMLSVVVAVAVLGLLAGVAEARKVTIDIKRTDVTSYTPENTDLGNYYAFDVPMPEKLAGETFMDAHLELYVDVLAGAEVAAGIDYTTFEVFPLKSSLSGEVDSSKLRLAAMKRTVRVGESQRVKVNISEHVRHVLANPSDDFGLVVGSLTGQRLGKFAVKHGVLGPGVVARVTIVFHKLGMPDTASQ